MSETSRRMEAGSNWEERLLRNPSRQADLNPEYQELKFALHRKLLDRINLDALASIGDDHIHAEVRQAVMAMLEEIGRAHV